MKKIKDFFKREKYTFTIFGDEILFFCIILFAIKQLLVGSY